MQQKFSHKISDGFIKSAYIRKFVTLNLILMIMDYCK